MQVAKTLSLIFISLIPTILFSQSNSDTSICYIDSIKNEEKVFTKIQINASFKGGQRNFQNFLIKNINHSRFITELSRSQSIYADTAKIKFIIDKRGIMSNMLVSGAHHAIFQNEIQKVIKFSSCFWDPGNYNGRNVNGWYQYDIFYFIELKRGELKITVSFKSYEYVD